MDRLNLTVDIKPNKIGPKEINVRNSLMAGNLIAEIQDKFNLGGTLQLRPKGSSDVLGWEVPLDQAGVEDGMVLFCEQVIEETGTLDRIELGVRDSIEGDFKRIYVVEKQTLLEFDVNWQPAIIGRRDHRNPSKNRLLAIDLEGVEDLPTVSRHHACITSGGGKFFIEQIQERNPTYVDGRELDPNTKSALPAGAVIQVGRVSLTFNVLS
ncbi:MAG: FHA domain-containing protein [Anaerolineales bacterium]|jgi:hypothetical protein